MTPASAWLLLFLRTRFGGIKAGSTDLSISTLRPTDACTSSINVYGSNALYDRCAAECGYREDPGPSSNEALEAIVAGQTHYCGPGWT
jgi:hypothetical protein